MFSRIRYSSFFAAFLVFLVIAAWIVFLPIQFGGVTAYVIVNGNSMEPTYYKGDLVILRHEASYGVGDIVTYYNTDIGQYVIHRIIAEQARTFVLQGDNNTWVDGEQPAFNAIVGKAWIHIPGLGDWLSYIQTPLGLALLSGLIIFVVFSMYAIREKETRKRIQRLLSGVRVINVSFNFSPGDATMKKIGRQLEIFIFAFVIFFAGSLLLAFASFTKDENLNKTVDTEYLHIGLFSYSASPAPGVYDPGSPGTGDPIFLKTTCQVTVRFDYRLAGEALADAQGTISLRAEARDINGWRRSFELVPQTGFQGTTTYVQADVNPCQILSVLRQAEDKTQLHRNGYQLMLIPKVDLRGAGPGGQQIETQFVPSLNFALDDFQMYVLNEFPEVDPLSPFKMETKASANQLPNLIQLPGFSITVSLARILSVMGLLFSLGLGIFLGWQVTLSLRSDPAIAISLRYGSLLVDVEQVSFNVRSREIIVASIEDIVKLAERNATVVMHLRRPDRDEFLVEGNNTIYRFDLPRRRSNENL